MKKRHQKSPMEIQTDILLGKARAIQKMTPEQLYECARGGLSDTKINLGYKIGFSLALIELMMYWEETDENLKDFIARHEEFLEVYASTDAQDKKKMLDLLNELERRTGYTVVMNPDKEKS